MSRFQPASPYKNQLPATKRESWWSELPLAEAVHDSSDGLTTAWTYCVVPSSSKGQVVCLPYNRPGKYAFTPPSYGASSGSILDLDTAFHDLLAVSSDDSTVSVFRLPSALSDGPPTFEPLTALQLEAPSAQLRFHPHASGLAFAVSGSVVNLLQTSTSHVTLKLKGPAKGLWSASWSADGRTVASTGKDQSVQIWDPRASTDAVNSAPGHQGIKASRTAFVGDQLFTTGFSKMRDREYALRDLRNLEKPLKVQRLDTGTGVLIPLVDEARNMVYLAGRGDMVLRWTELVGSSQVFADGSAPLPVPIVGAAMAPRAILDVMHTEINRVLVSSKDGSALPVSVGVPRRQYLDFHAELFPPERSEIPALSAEGWLSGQNDLVAMTPVQPRSRHPVQPPIRTTDTVSNMKPQHAKDPSASHTNGLPLIPSVAATAEVHAREVASPDPMIPSMLKSSETSTPPSAVAPRAVQDSPKTPKRPWSRNFLSGKTNLKPDYEGLSGLAPTSASDISALQANTKFFVFPLQGPGGRLGVHKVASKGRLPTLIPAIATGQSIAGFTIDPFDPHRLTVAGGDGRIRIYRLPDVGLTEGQDMTQVNNLLESDGIDRIQEIRHHPTASDVISTLSEDSHITHFRVWNVETGTVPIKIPLEGSGVFASAWSNNGRLVALTGRDKVLRILDPRTGHIVAKADSHHSTRPSRPLWLDDERHILTTGFTLSSNREIRIYRLDGDELKRTVAVSLDASPAPLVPFHDVDTGIIFLCTRGERSIRAYDASSYTSLTALPSFEDGTVQHAIAFLPKRHVDVKAVEVTVGYRLTSTSIQRITWSIPRAQAQFFQDDVFPPTRDVEKPALSAEAWFQGETSVQALVDLRPADMTPLSQTPEAAAVVSTRNKISGPVITDSQKREQQLDRLFQRARQDTAEDEGEARAGVSLTALANAPDDDDW